MQFQRFFLFWDCISLQHARNASVEMAYLLVIQIKIQTVWFACHASSNFQGYFSKQVCVWEVCVSTLEIGRNSYFGIS